MINSETHINIPLILIKLTSLYIPRDIFVVLLGNRKHWFGFSRDTMYDNRINYKFIVITD